MSLKKWLFMIIFAVLILTIGIASLNIAVDPMVAFGGHLMEWYSYDNNRNPRIANTSYMDEGTDEYDSFIVGSSSISSLPLEQLNKYMNAKFCNLSLNSADMYDIKQTTEYIINNYKVKNLVLNLGFINAMKYMNRSDTLTDKHPHKTEGASQYQFLRKHLFADPYYRIEKLKANMNESYSLNEYNTFEVSTAAYDKSKIEIENVQDINTYLDKYPIFKDYPKDKQSLENIDVFISDITLIKSLCDMKNINLIVVIPPMYSGYTRNYNSEQLTEIYSRLAEITGFWDFLTSSITSDSRFFYDGTHFRNAMGKMVLAKIFNDKDVYKPYDIGVYVTRENAVKRSKEVAEVGKFDETTYTKKVPVLMYHDLAEKSSGPLVISTKAFEAQIKALAEAGYTGISFQNMMEYVENGVELPEKPVVITFDDAYLSNYELAFPILKKYNMKASIFVIGSSVGKDTYKDTGNAITPHFTYEQAKEMLDSGLIDIQSHTYDMHQWACFEKGKARTGIMPLEGEDETVYIENLKKDITLSKEKILAGTGHEATVLSYPFGKYNELSEIVLSKINIKATLTTKAGTNTIIKGLPQCLRAMKRYGITEDISPNELIKLIK